MASSERVHNVLTGASELPPHERAGYLDAACRGDAELRAEVDSLLKSLDEAGEFLASPTAEIKPGSSYSRNTVRMTSASGGEGGPRELEGQMIGRYKLLQPIGEGGFGIVWMAEQREPVKRRVALKIIKLGMDTRQVIARFEAERQALAMMDHPNIAKVLDAGATETGRPFFVMEYIRGVPILEYCDTDKLNTKSRLELFASVCHAIQHAHQKGIIHRDIKPSNVLVTMHDGVPVPKVIDFGIAKATSSELTSKTLFTEHRQMIGTPAYMSPEQAEMSGLDIDTRTDIYSLGVLLYELLTGTTPFGHAELMSKGFAEMVRIIREVEPHKPSTRLSSLGETGTRTAQQRQAVDSKKLGGTLRGDLDWIVMKCLDKDRTRRYESASGLAADIKRHLSDEPISAGAPSGAYKLHKFVKRNRVIVAAGGVVAAALVLGAIGATAGMISASNARDRAESDRMKATIAAEAEAIAKLAALENEQRAIAEAKRAEEAREDEAKARNRAEIISGFVTSVLRSGDSQNLAEFSGAGQDMTILTAMDNAVRDINAGRFKDDPQIEAELLSTIAQIVRNNGRVQMAEPLVARALELNRDLHKTNHPDLASSLEHVAIVRMQLGNFNEVEAPMVEAVAMRRRLHTDGDNALAGTLQSMGELRAHQGRLTESEALLAEALELSRDVHSGDHPEVAICLNNLALVKQSRGLPEQAEPLFVEALEMHQRLHPEDHPEVAAGLSNLGLVRAGMGRLIEAEQLCAMALEMRERLYKGDHPSIAINLMNLAATREQLQRSEEAEHLAVRAVAMNRRLFGGDHQDVANSLMGLAKIVQSLGRTEEAERLFVEALEMSRRVFKGDSPDRAFILNNLGVLRQQSGRADEAEPLLTEALEMRERMIKGDHQLIVANLRNLASVQRDLGRESEAQTFERRADDMNARIAANSLTVVQDVRVRLAVQHWERGEFDKSVPMFESLLKDQERKFGREHPLTRFTAANLGVNYKDVGRFAEGIPLLESAYQASKQQPDLAFIRLHVIDAYARSADSATPVPLARATAFIDDFVATARKENSPESSELAAQLSLAAQAFLANKAWNNAEPLAREALAIREVIQPDAWNTFNTRSILGGTLLGQGKIAEAEPLLLDGYRGMVDRKGTIPPQAISRLPEAIDRLIMLAVAKGDLDKAAQLRAERATYAPAHATQ